MFLPCRVEGKETFSALALATAFLCWSSLFSLPLLFSSSVLSLSSMMRRLRLRFLFRFAHATASGSSSSELLLSILLISSCEN